MITYLTVQIVHMFHAILRLRCTFSESWDCDPNSRLFTILCKKIAQLRKHTLEKAVSKLFHKGMKDDKITVTGDDLDVSTWAACWPVNEIGGGQDGVIPISLGHLCRLWRETPLIKDVFHPVSYTVDCSLSSVQQSSTFVDYACKSCNFEIVHVLRNLQIAQILRLHATCRPYYKS